MKYDHLRRACDIPDDTYVPSWFASSGVEAPTSAQPVSTACARAVGSAIGLDWAAFADEPHEFSTPASPTETLVAGLVTLLASDVGTEAEFEASVGVDEGMGRMFLSDSGDLGSDPDAPAGAVWLSLLEQGIRSVQPGDGDCESGTVMRNVDRDVTLCDGPAASLLVPGTPNVVAILAHEASHTFLGPHDARGGTWDSEPTGAYGVQARFLYAWRAHAPLNEQGPYACWSAITTQIDACAGIVDRAGFAPCEDLEAGWTACETGYGGT